MNSHLLHCFILPRGLYIPKKQESFSENILRSDCIGICCVATANTYKVLSSSAVLRHRSTTRSRTCSGSISGIYSYKTNTVLLSFMTDPCYCLHICPRCQGSTKSFASVRFLTSFHVVESLNSKNSNFVPWELIQGSPDIVGSLGISSFPTFASRFPTIDFIPNEFEISSIMIPVRSGHQFIYSEINSQNGTCCSKRFIRQFNKKSNLILAQRTALNQTGSWISKPFIKDSRFASRKHNPLSGIQCRETNNKIKRSMSLFNSYKLGVQRSRTMKFRYRYILLYCFSRLFGSYYRFQSLLKCLRFIPSTQTSTIQSCKCFFVKSSRCIPKRTNIEINGSSIGFKQIIDLISLALSSKFKSYLDGPSHSRDSLTCGLV